MLCGRGMLRPWPASWRIPVGQSGLLDHFLRRLCSGAISDALRVQCLRIVGNAVADTGNVCRILVDMVFRY